MSAEEQNQENTKTEQEQTTENQEEPKQEVIFDSTKESEKIPDKQDYNPEEYNINEEDYQNVIFYFILRLLCISAILLKTVELSNIFLIVFQVVPLLTLLSEGSVTSSLLEKNSSKDGLEFIFQTFLPKSQSET